MIIDVEDYLDSIGVFEHLEDSEFLAHYGTPRHSGRYPWGSGKDGDGSQRNQAFLDSVNELKRQGLSDTEIAKGLGMTTSQLRTSKSIAKNAQKQANIAYANRLKDTGMSNVAIGKEMGLGESSVRALLQDGVNDKLEVLNATSNVLRKRIDDGAYLDVGTGVEQHLGISRSKLDTAVQLLKQDGYELINVQVDQLGTDKKTTMKVLAPPGTKYIDVKQNLDQIKQVQDFSDDGGRTFLGIQPPMSISSKRVAVKYAEEGGSDADGVIYVRPGVKDISIGNSRYAQVRISVDGTHFLKGMAVYKDDLPAGVDLMFNTNKSSTGNKLDAMKPIKSDPDNPFGATVRQLTGPDGKLTSVMNIVGNPNNLDSGVEGSWGTWSRNLPSQFLSKQSPRLAKQQLDVTYERRKQEYDDIMALTNPLVKRRLLEAYADSVDSAAVHLKAAALPRQSTHVILPVNTLKDNEIYAPNFKSGERVALVRFPHGGTFEIPELTVNNEHRPAQKLLGKQPRDAIGINSRVAGRLSGADFDGDTVLVIPNNSGKVKSTPALESLKKFDPQKEYKGYTGMKVMGERTKAIQMGEVSNLITDMTIKGASPSELARAVRHSMVVIDAAKHGLDYRRSARDNGITALKAKYQNSNAGGASTIISRASSDIKTTRYKERSPRDGGPIDPKTGKKIYVEETWTTRSGETVYKQRKSTKLAEADDAYSLVSSNGGTKIEAIYADHSNRLKSMANQARRESLRTPSIKRSPSAAKAYSSEVASLNAKLNLAIRNRPLERQAQVIANTTLKMKRQANPEMGPDEVKKVKSQALDAARIRTGAKKSQIIITDDEWKAIQSGAISHSKLDDILRNSDIDRVKALATPKTQVLMSPSKTSRAQAMMALGYPQSEIAEALGVSLSTLERGLS